MILLNAALLDESNKNCPALDWWNIRGNEKYIKEGSCDPEETEPCCGNGQCILDSVTKLRKFTVKLELYKSEYL